ncbi:MAG TPA: hypothetical protein VJ508_13470, partial [Saprospiraceae bacterium]|nr:hypothetical protein [Saprospiraceae bacterium]
MKKYLILFQITLSAWLTQAALAQNVGIGTLAPTNLLDVQGATGVTTPVINAKVNYTGTSNVSAVEGYSVPSDGSGYGGKFSGGLAGVQGAGLGGSNVSAVYGLYGFATGSAGARYGLFGLAVGGSSNYGVYGTAVGGAGYYGVYGNNTNTAGYAGYFNGRGLFTDDLGALDNVGIGTSATPSTRLQILNGADCSLTTNGFIQLGATNSWNVIIDDNEIMGRNNGAGNDLFIQNDAGNVLLCGNEQGKVGIGLTAGSNIPAGYLFAVDGKIIAEELRIQNSINWPDYVFEKNYHRPSLDELKTA